jgi:hypothetical protein
MNIATKGKKIKYSWKIESIMFILEMVERDCCLRLSVNRTFTGIKLMFVTLVTYIPTWRTRKMVN